MLLESELISTFQTIDDNLNEAYEINDCNKISELLSDSWTLLEPGFGIVSKGQFLESVKCQKLIHKAMKKVVIRANCFDAIAIVISRGKNTGIYGDKPFDTEVWVTNIYRNEGRGWISISTQESPIPCL